MEPSEPKSATCTCGQVLAAGVTSCPSCGRWISQLELTSDGPPEADLEKIVVLKGWATAEQVQQALAMQLEQTAKGRKLRLGEALVEMGVLKVEQVRQALTLQGKVAMRCPKCAKTFNVRGYRPGTRALCKVCKAPLVPPSSASDLHVDDTQGGLQQVEVGEAVAAELINLVPGYTIERRLGAGGMGEVFLARQKSLDRLVALKILTDSLGKDQTYVQRFLSEARSAAKLSHENIVAAVDSGEAQGRSYFVMEYVEGETLADILSREKTIAEKRALGYARQIARGLKHAHHQGIIHRDIKPSNVMINYDGVAKICDFGLARDINHDIKLTQAGHVHASPAYSSPEQCKGRRDLDHRADMYSLGITLFEMLTGQLPFDASVPSAIFVKHVNETPPPPIDINRSLSAGANQLVLRLLRKHPDGRFRDYDELLASIDAVEQGRPASKTHDTVRRTARPRRPAWIPWAGAAAGVVLLVVILSSMKGGPRTPTSPPPAVGPADAAANRELQEARAFQKSMQGNVPKYLEVKAMWRGLEEKHRGTPNHPFFAGAMVEFDSLLEKEAVDIADVLVALSSRHRENGRFADASLALRDYSPSFAGTEGHRRVEALRDALKKTIEINYADAKERLLVHVSSEKFDQARKELSNLQALVSRESGGKLLYTDERYSEELKALARTIDEESILARQREAQAKTPEATPAVSPAAKPPVAPAEVVKTPTPAPVKPVAPKVEAARAPAPAAAAKKEAEAVVRDLFKEDYAKKSPSDRGILARKLLKLAKETKDDPVGRFVLLTEAMELGVLAGEVELSFEAVREAVALYEVDGPALKASVMSTAVSNARSDEQFRALARLTLEVAEEAFAGGNVDQAHKLATAALSHAKRARDVSTASAADAKVKEYAELKDFTDRLTKARETLAKNPNDAASALVVGQYTGAVKGDWTEALPLLARGSDPLFKRAAEKDLTKPTDPLIQGEVGDAWFDAAEKSPEWAKAGIRARAVEWYERAFAGLTGLHKTRVEQRLAQLSGGAEKGGWLRIRAPKAFGLSGGIDEPMVLQAPANDAVVAKLEPFPAGDFDGVSVKLKLPPAGRVQVHLVFEPRAHSVTVQRQTATQVIVADTASTPSRNLKVEQHPGVEEFVFEVLLEGGEYLVRVNGRETMRVPTTRTTLSGVWLQSNWNTARFDDVKLRRKK